MASGLRNCMGGVVAASLFLTAAAAWAAPWPDTVCHVPFQAVTHPETLVRSRALLADGKPLTIVAFGSSSTEGAGASSTAATYPAQLESLLRERAGLDVRVLNRGKGGETVEEMRTRLNRDVLAEKPDLVIWQVGSNEVLRAMPPALFASLLEHDVDRMKAAGIDLILMGPQAAPRLDISTEIGAIITDVHSVAAKAGIALMPRHRIMLAWTASPGFPGPAISADGLHMNDLGYHCLALLLAEAITGAPLPSPQDD